MVKRVALLAGLTLLLSVAFVPAAHAQTRFSFQFGMSPGPAPGYVWQDGYYVQSGYGDRWIPGGWVPARYGRRDWDAERWERDHRELHRDLEREHREFHRNEGGRRDRDRSDWDRDREHRNWDRDERDWRR
jgi:hypothetical protein